MNSASNRWLAAPIAVTAFARSGSRIAAAVITIFTVALGACGGDSSGPDPDPGPVPVATVEVAAATTTFEVGGLLQLTATARDATGNVLTGRATTWSSTNLGVATVTSAGLVNGVASGSVTINATVGGVSGGIQITVTAPPPVILSSISPNPLVPGQGATLTGTGFSTVPAANAVSLGGTPATVTGATPTALTITVPASLCTSPGSIEVKVTVGGRTSNPIQQPAQTSGTAVTAATGQMQFLQSGFCLQFGASAASDTFLIGVQNYSEDVTSVTPVTVAMSAAFPSPVFAAESEMATFGTAVESPQIEPARALRWARHRQAELALRRAERSLPVPDLTPAGRGQASFSADGAASIPAVVNVGDNIAIRVPDRDNLCAGFTAITTVVKYVGAKSVWLEDTSNPAGGFSASDYQSLATMFDSKIFATVVDYFGSPSDIDQNGRIVIVVTKEVNNANILGFTTTADLLTNCASSDNGEIYYTRAVDAAGQFGDAYPLASALVDAPQLLAHEVAHISQFTIRASQSGFNGILQSIWELEGQATFSEEVVGHVITGHTTGQNYGFEVAFNCVPGSNPCADEFSIAWYIGAFVDMALYYGFDPDAANPQQTPISGAPEQCSWLNLSSNGNTGPCFSGREVYGVPFLLLRYISDQYGPQFPGGEKELHKKLILGNRAGFDNISSLIGQPMDRVLAEWAAALYVDDRIAAPAARLKFTSWNMFNIEQRLVPPARLRPRMRTFNSFSDQVSVRAGSTAYFVVSGTHAASALRMRGAGETSLPPNMRVWIVRLK